MNQLISNPDAIDSLSTFLKYGPTGLAGLMLFLTVIALGVREISEARERLLRQFMYVGAGCFALALVANYFTRSGVYPLYFRVFPLDTGTRNTLPLPIVTVNSHRLDTKMTYLMRSEATAIVDVSDAMNFVAEFRMQNSQMRQTLAGVSRGADVLVADLQRVPQIVDRNCSGGSSGRPASSNPTVIAITSRAASVIANFKEASSAAIRTPAPEINE